jgi:hypothetical protein
MTRDIMPAYLERFPRFAGGRQVIPGVARDRFALHSSEVAEARPARFLAALGMTRLDG